ncbi:heme-binding protein [Methyloversatilis discipulorum]|uniref:GlcG/HbpS family heme-binding protein n=1 Tax=Methyloversatilis discipulorum TaxID=1119528 RepID=UPI00313838DE
MKKLIALGLLAASFAVQAQTAQPALDLATAKAIAEGCEKYAASKGWRMITAVHDTAGNPKYFSRMDGSILISVQVAQLKADTSASLPVSTRQFRELAKGIPGAEVLPRTTSIIGGLPIMTSKGVHIGGVGVSGGSEEEDEECAKKGLEAAKNLL